MLGHIGMLTVRSCQELAVFYWGDRLLYFSSDILPVHSNLTSCLMLPMLFIEHRILTVIPIESRKLSQKVLQRQLSNGVRTIQNATSPFWWVLQFRGWSIVAGDGKADRLTERWGYLIVPHWYYYACFARLEVFPTGRVALGMSTSVLWGHLVVGSRKVCHSIEHLGSFIALHWHQNAISTQLQAIHNARFTFGKWVFHSGGRKEWS
jgi:hypothetical protein